MSAMYGQYSLDKTMVKLNLTLEIKAFYMLLY